MILMIVLLGISCLTLLGFYQRLRLRCLVAESKVKNQEELKETFRSVSMESLERTQSYLHETSQQDLAYKQKVITGLVDSIHAQMRLIENERKVDHGAIDRQLHNLIEAERQLRLETSKLSQALRSPTARGRWGEIQLKRVVELAGMVAHCDFFEQVYDANKSHRRPDLIVRLPGERQVIIDAKVPLEAYLESLDIKEDILRLEKLRLHARHVKDHIQQLSKKTYWEHFSSTPEFVVLFLPSETIFAVALEADPSLIEYGADQSVILATPTTLIALLRAISYGWKQDNLSRHVEKVRDLGHDLYKQILEMATPWSQMGRSLDQAIKSYNQATSALEKKVLSTTRQFSDLGASSSITPLKELQPLKSSTRLFSQSEMKSDE